MSSNQKLRSSLRLQLRHKRRQLSRKQQHTHGRLLAKNLCLNRHFRQIDHVGFYLPEDGEISTTEAIKTAWQQNKTVYLPVLSPYANELFFAPYTDKSQMKKNRFGIAEPDISIKKCLKAHQLQLICMPLVGFDANCNRLGMGGGFYDRSLHFRHHQKQWKSPKLIGFAHECQKLDKVPTEHWDIPVDGILTEKTYYK